MSHFKVMLSRITALFNSLQAMAFMEETPTNLKPNLMNVYDLESSNFQILLAITKSVVGMSMLLRGTTLYFYLGTLACMFIPVVTDAHPYCYVPWLVVALFRCVVFNLFLLFSGVCVCLIFAPIKPACMEFVFIKMFEAVIYTYYWIKINRAYIQLCRQTGVEYISFLKHFQNKDEYRRQEITFRRCKLRTLGNRMPPSLQLNHKRLKSVDNLSCSTVDSDFSCSSKIDSDFSTKCSQSLDSFFAQATMDWFIKEAIIHQNFEKDDEQYELGLAERAAKFLKGMLGNSVGRRRRPATTAVESEFDAITHLLPLQTTHRYHPSSDVDVRTHEEGVSSEELVAEEVETELTEKCTEFEEVVEIEEVTTTKEVTETGELTDVQKVLKSNQSAENGTETESRQNQEYCGDTPGEDKETCKISNSRERTGKQPRQEDADGQGVIEGINKLRTSATTSSVDKHDKAAEDEKLSSDGDYSASPVGHCFFGCHSALCRTVPFDSVIDINQGGALENNIEESLSSAVKIDQICEVHNRKSMIDSTTTTQLQNTIETEEINQSNDINRTMFADPATTPSILHTDKSIHETVSVTNTMTKISSNSAGIDTNNFGCSPATEITLVNQDISTSQTNTHQAFAINSTATSGNTCSVDQQTEPFIPTVKNEAMTLADDTPVSKHVSIVGGYCSIDETLPLVQHDSTTNKNGSNHVNIVASPTVEKITLDNHDSISEPNTPIEKLPWAGRKVFDSTQDQVASFCNQSMTQATTESIHYQKIAEFATDDSSTVHELNSVDRILKVYPTKSVSGSSVIERCTDVDQIQRVDGIIEAEKHVSCDPSSNAKSSAVNKSATTDSIEAAVIGSTTEESAAVDQIPTIDLSSETEKNSLSDIFIPMKQTAILVCSTLSNHRAEPHDSTSIKLEAKEDQSNTSLQTALFDYISATVDSSRKLNRASTINQLPATTDFGSAYQSTIPPNYLNSERLYVASCSNATTYPEVGQTPISNQPALLDSNSDVVRGTPIDYLPTCTDALSHVETEKIHLRTEKEVIEDQNCITETAKVALDRTFTHKKLTDATYNTPVTENSTVTERNSNGTPSLLDCNTCINDRISFTNQTTAILDCASNERTFDVNSTAGLQKLALVQKKSTSKLDCTTCGEKLFRASLFDPETSLQVSRGSCSKPTLPTDALEITLTDCFAQCSEEKSSSVHSILSPAKTINFDKNSTTDITAQFVGASSPEKVSSNECPFSGPQRDCSSSLEKMGLLDRVSATVFHMLMSTFSTVDCPSTNGNTFSAIDLAAPISNSKGNCPSSRENVFPVIHTASSESATSTKCPLVPDKPLSIINPSIPEKTLPVDLISVSDFKQDLSSTTCTTSATGIFQKLIATFSSTNGCSSDSEKNSPDSSALKDTSPVEVAKSNEKTSLVSQEASEKETVPNSPSAYSINSSTDRTSCSEKNLTNCFSSLEEEPVKPTPTAGVFQRPTAKFPSSPSSTAAKTPAAEATFPVEVAEGLEKKLPIDGEVISDKSNLTNCLLGYEKNVSTDCSSASGIDNLANCTASREESVNPTPTVGVLHQLNSKLPAQAGSTPADIPAFGETCPTEVAESRKNRSLVDNETIFDVKKLMNYPSASEVNVSTDFSLSGKESLADCASSENVSVKTIQTAGVLQKTKLKCSSPVGSPPVVEGKSIRTNDTPALQTCLPGNRSARREEKSTSNPASAFKNVSATHRVSEKAKLVNQSGVINESLKTSSAEISVNVSPVYNSLVTDKNSVNQIGKISEKASFFNDLSVVSKTSAASSGKVSQKLPSASRNASFEKTSPANRTPTSAFKSLMAKFSKPPVSTPTSVKTITSVINRSTEKKPRIDCTSKSEKNIHIL